MQFNLWRNYVKFWKRSRGNNRIVFFITLTVFLIFLIHITKTVARPQVVDDAEEREAPAPTVHFLHDPNIKKVNPDDLVCIPDAAALNTHAEGQFTIVMPTFNRKTTLTQILEHYLQMERVHRLILVWFKEEGVVPVAETLVRSPLSHKLLVKQIRDDNLMLRFLPMEEIETQAVFSVDDDMMVEEDDVYRAFNVWKSHPQGMVGWFMRLHEEKKRNSYHYVYNPTEEYTIVLTNAGFYHRKWNYILINQMPGGIKDVVKKWINCEDIAMNFLISSHCGEKGAIYLEPLKAPNHFSELKQSLSGRRSHAQQRDECVTYFVKHYTRDPLHKKSVKDTTEMLRLSNLL